MLHMYLHELKAHAKSLVIWVTVLFLLVLVAMAKFQAYYNNPEMLKVLDSMPKPPLPALPLPPCARPPACGVSATHDTSWIAFMSHPACGSIAVISWMAGLLYLPRLFVYHSENVKNGGVTEIFKVMERRLLKAIMTPAMILTWALGLTLWLGFGSVSLADDRWFHVKLALVILLSIYHMYLGKLTRNFAQDKNLHGSKFYRLINEVPTVLMIGIVIMVIVRPF